MKYTRDITLDIIRTCAIFCVIGVHSFSTPREYCFPQSILRTLSVLGVPLFLLLTGFLTSNKTLEDYYKKNKWKTIIPNYIAYIILGSICFLTPCVIFRENFNVFTWIQSLLNFTCTPYGWYMEMWIGLFFLTPFINIILHNLTKNQELGFILTLLFLSQLASTINRNGNIFFPSYWESIWPLTFFVTGHYLKIYPIKIKTTISIALIILGCLIEYVFNWLHNTTDNYLYILGGHNMIIYYLLGIILFLLLKKIQNINNHYIKRLIFKCAELSFFMYS